MQVLLRAQQRDQTRARQRDQTRRYSSGMQKTQQLRDIVVIGASAGGVDAIVGLLQSLPEGLAAAILVVLHIPSHTPSQLDEVLEQKTPFSAVVAKDGDVLERGRVYVASADRHLMVTSDGIRVTRGPKESRARPSIDVLFRSAAVAYGPRVIGVVLSGALDDGTAGLWAIRDHGGVALAQCPDEAQVASMPQSAIEHVQIDTVGPVKELASRIAALVNESAAEPEVSPSDQRHQVENTIALEGNGLQAGVMNIGDVSKYTCPDCHGVLVQIEEGSIVRFRCHTGHAFSIQSLIVEVNDAIDDGLWATIRAIEERIMLLRQVATLSRSTGHEVEAHQCSAQADDAERRLKPLRDLVLDPAFFGHASVDGSTDTDG